MARIHAEIWTDLAEQGHVVAAHDLWIAATAIAHGMGVATRNVEEFRRVSGLRVVGLGAWPDPASPTLIQVTVVPVPARLPELAHHHADLRYVLATGHPESMTAELASAPLRLLSSTDALALASDDSLRHALQRVEQIAIGLGTSA